MPLDFVVGSLGDEAIIEMSLQGINVAVMDPPRRGLDKRLLENLCDAANKYPQLFKLYYVSCGFKAFTYVLSVALLMPSTQPCM